MVKKEKEKEEKYYNMKYSKAKLELDKSVLKVNESTLAKEDKNKILEKIASARKKLGEYEKIDKKKREIYQHSRIGKAEKKVGSMVDSFMKQKITSKRVLKPNKMTVTIREVNPESVWNDKNRFFTGQFNHEKRSLFFE